MGDFVSIPFPYSLNNLLIVIVLPKTIYSSLSVISDEEADIEPTLSIMARSTVYNVGETKGIFCKGRNIVEVRLQ